jgi:ABC-type hemin transport system substrate-binding protein
MEEFLFHKIPNPRKPVRIISLVPSITELLGYLDLENEIVGITKFCVRPSNIFKIKPKIGGTKNVDINKIISINPDLIIANKEENTESQIIALSQLFPV